MTIHITTSHPISGKYPDPKPLRTAPPSNVAKAVERIEKSRATEGEETNDLLVLIGLIRLDRPAKNIKEKNIPSGNLLQFAIENDHL